MRARSTLWVVGAAALALALPWETGASQARTTPQQQYYPGRDRDWERRRPEDVGMDPRLLEEAVAFARANESPESRDLEFNHHATFGREPSLAEANERLGRHTLGEARLGRSSTGESTASRLCKARAQRAWYIVQVQRCSGERTGVCSAASLAPPAATGFARVRNGSYRRL